VVRCRTTTPALDHSLLCQLHLELAQSSRTHRPRISTPSKSVHYSSPSPLRPTNLKSPTQMFHSLPSHLYPPLRVTFLNATHDSTNPPIMRLPVSITPTSALTRHSLSQILKHVSPFPAVPLQKQMQIPSPLPSLTLILPCLLALPSINNYPHHDAIMTVPPPPLNPIPELPRFFKLELTMKHAPTARKATQLKAQLKSQIHLPRRRTTTLSGQNPKKVLQAVPSSLPSFI
jgi:hypothetical protein